MARYGDTAVLCTVTASKEPRILDFFPLTVNYEERLYAVGKFQEDLLSGKADQVKRRYSPAD